MDIFKDFPPVTGKWEDSAEAELRQSGAAEKLRWHTDEGFALEAYYDSVSTEAALTSACIRSLKKGKNDQAEFWQVAAMPAGASPKAALDALEGGCNGLSLSGGHFGETLREVLTSYVYIEIHGDADVARRFRAWSGQRDENQLPNGLLNYSPLSSLAATGKWNGESDLKALQEHVDFTLAHFPATRAIEVDGLHAAEAGGTLSQQVAYCLLQGMEYLEALTRGSITATQANSLMQFRLGYGPVFLLELVKADVLRLLWAKVLDSYGVQNGRTFVHAVMASHLTSTTDSHNNILRYTTAALSAYLGGADALSIPPFDNKKPCENPFSDRISRNISNMLLLESRMEEYKGAVEGSFYLGEARHQLARSSWEIFCRWQRQGSFSALLTSGYLREELAKSAGILKDKLRRGERVLIGVNKFRSNQPPSAETMVKAKPDPDFPAIAPVSFANELTQLSTTEKTHGHG